MKLEIRNFFFILGGDDNEMVEIKRVLERQMIPYWQPQVEWGTIKIDFKDLPLEARDRQLIFVECRPDSETLLFRSETLNRHIQIIDHHNQLSHNPASLTQVLNLLNLKPTIRQQIIASIDSDFLAKTIAKWPERKKQIIKIWEAGYQQKFDSKEDYQSFKKYCQELFNKALKSKKDNLLIIEQAPDSRTMLAAMANLAGVECCLISGSLDSGDLKPCSYIGRAEIVKKLAKKNFARNYWGKYYFGCRVVPQEFLNFVRNSRHSREGGNPS